MNYYLIYINIFLIFLWILTTIAIVWYFIKRKTKPPRESNASDFLLSMISEKHNESLQATRKLTEVANFLKIGLIEYKNNNLINLNNIKEIFNVNDNIIQNITSEIDLKNTNPKTLNYDNLAFQINYLKLTDNHYIILIQDVSETYFLALKLKEREKFAILGQITAQMAHQLKTQLAILAGKAQLLSKKLENNQNIHPDDLNEIFIQSRQISEKINEIVSIYKEKNINRENINLYEFLTKLISELKEIHKNFNFTINSYDNIIVNTDINILKNIIYLIIQNSLHEQSEANQIIFNLFNDNNKVLLQIIDNGKGIPDTIKDKIFQPFFTTKEDGMGLGLFLAKDLANLLNIEIINEPVEKGTKFNIIIPC